MFLDVLIETALDFMLNWKLLKATERFNGGVFIMSESVNQIFTLLEKCGLLNSADLSHAVSRWNKSDRPDVNSSTNCLKWLVTNKYLTHYQATKVMRGEGKELIVEDYRVKDQLKLGGFSGGLLASDPLNRPVIIHFAKLDALKTKESQDFFKGMVEKASMFENSHFQRVISSGVENARFFIVREWWDGTTLGAILNKKGKIDAPKACRIFAYVLGAVQALQEAGLPVGEITLGSIYLASENSKGDARVVKLIGTGFSSGILESDIDENLSAKGSEVLQIGRAMFHAITGKEASLGKSESVRSLVPDVSELVADFVDQLADVDPEIRFESAKVAAKALRILIATEEAEANTNANDNLNEIVIPKQSPESSGKAEMEASEFVPEEIDWISSKTDEILKKLGILPRELVFLAVGALASVAVLLVGLWLIGDIVPVIALGLGAVGGYFLNDWLSKQSKNR